jgi:tetratricopeptide (TPR) repeat protein
MDLQNDRTLWADSYDRRLRSSMDVFGITDEISRAIVNELRLTIGTTPRRYDLDVESYDLYLRARAITEAGNAEAAGQAIPLFERIIADDPAFAPAYAGLAHAYFLGSLPTNVGEALRFDTIFGPMRAAAAKALELDPLLAEAHAAMGAVYARELRWADSESSFRRAIDLDPTRASSYTLFAVATLRPLGEHAEAQRILELALEQDPLSVDVQFELAFAEFIDGSYEDAVARLRPLLAENPEPSFIPALLARALTFAGRIDEAMTLWQSLDYERYPSYYASTLVRAGRRAEVEALARANPDHAQRQLFTQAALGNRDLAFAALDRMVIDEPHRVPLIVNYPELEILRSDPRLDAIRTRFRLP